MTVLIIVGIPVFIFLITWYLSYRIRLAIFFSRLSKWKGKFIVGPDSYGIRARVDGYPYCPITAVYKGLTGHYKLPIQADECGAAMCLGTSLTNSIMYAADFGRSTKLRKKLLKTLNLAERK